VVTELRTQIWLLKGAVSRRLLKLPVLGRAFAFVGDRLFRRHFVPDLRRLHDALANTEMAERYWVWAGMLLGWAREGNLLSHDRDADFALLAQDLPHLLKAIPALRAAGFQPLLQFRNNQGRMTELTLRRHAATFEFFVFEPIDGMLHYFVYGWPPDHLIEVEAQVSDQDLVPFDFLGRTWLRHVDFESELESMYGDWRTPQLQWNYLEDDQAAVDRRPWVNTSTSWSKEAE
jgi:hypothetical protein